MTLAYWCVLIAGLMPLLTVAVAKWGRRDFDNAEPRAWLDRVEGLRRRANYAHQNHFEAFPFFAAAAIIAHQLHVAQHWIDALAVTFILARIIYTLLYFGDKPTLRSIVWSVGYLCVLGIFLSPLLHS